MIKQTRISGHDPYSGFFMPTSNPQMESYLIFPILNLLTLQNCPNRNITYILTSISKQKKPSLNVKERINPLTSKAFSFLSLHEKSDSSLEESLRINTFILPLYSQEFRKLVYRLHHQFSRYLHQILFFHWLHNDQEYWQSCLDLHER